MPSRADTFSAKRRTLVAAHTPALMLVADGGNLDQRAVLAVSGWAVRGGANVIQMRDASGWHAQDWPLDLAQELRERSMLLVHTSDAIACAIHAHGVHLPEALLPEIGAIHERWEGAIISCAVHNLEAALQAERHGADMLVLGTVFASKSHPGGAAIGIDGVHAVCDAVTIPVIGIGGITAQNAGDVIRAGASGVAVISAIFDAVNPRSASAELRAAIDEAWEDTHPAAVPPLHEDGEVDRG